MKKNLIVIQEGYKECGAASLLSIIRYYKGNISMSRLVELTNTNKNGTNFYQLKQASEKIGLNAVGYKVDNLTSIKEVNTPLICQLVDKNYEHFVVVYSIKNDKVTIMDPAIGEKKISYSKFESIWTGYILVFEPYKKLYCYQEKKYLNKIIKEVSKKNKSIILTILVLSIIYTSISCLCTLYFQFNLDFVIDTTKTNLSIITFIFANLFLIKCISSFFRNQLFIFFSQKLDCSIFISTFKKILLLPYSYYHNRTTGEIISRLNDLIYVKNLINKLILTVCLDSILLIVSSIMLLIINPIMFIYMIIITLIYLFIFLVFRPLLKRCIEQNQKNNATFNSFLVETIGGIETIKNMNIESTMNERMEDIYVKMLNDNFDYQNTTNVELFLKDIVMNIGLLLIEFVSFNMVMSHNISLGYLVSSIALTNYFLEPITNLIELNKEYYYAVNSIKRVNHLFEVKEEDLSTKTNLNLDGNLEIKDLSFSYNGEHNILKNINLSINKGNKVMILGSSGSGKSTILKLLLKYYKVERDKIYFNNIDINNYTISDIRNHMSYISQTETIYTDTILNNITLYKNYDESIWLDICKLTYVDEFVQKLFLGYDTRLEENGLNVSGGQRQRLILARTLLQGKDIILIDEGLNAIDVNLERKILKNIFSRYKNKTIIIVSHRCENIDLFDQVISFKDGQVINDIKKNYLKEAV